MKVVTRGVTNMKITQVIQKQLAAVAAHMHLPQPEMIHLEHPADTTHGDYASNIAMTFFGTADKENFEYKSPRELAAAIVEQLQKSEDAEFHQAVSEVSVAGPGFINFKLSETFLTAKMGEIIAKRGKTAPQIGEGKTVVVEYSSPNIAKPFTIGHLRSTIIGDAVANLLEAVGYQVKRDNHLGDWGTQFGKQIYAIKTWGDEEEIDQSENPVKELVQLYIKFHEEAEQDPEIEDRAREWFQKLEEGDVEARRLWQKCINWSWQEFEKIYQKLGVSFTENNGRGFGESFFEDKMSAVISELKEKGLLKESKDAQMFFFPNDELPPAMILKKDGSTLYATRDLATDRFRLDTISPEVLIINEVGAEQALYFRQLYRMEEMLGWVKPGQRVHVKHGLYRFKDKKMSTRKGNVIWLEEVLEEAKKRALVLSKDDVGSELIAEKVGIGALKWNDLKRSAHLDVVFDWDDILNLTGNSGPYLQYTYVRCHSVLSKALTAVGGSSGTDTNNDITNYIDTLINNKEYLDHTPNKQEIDILRNLYQYSEVITAAATEYAPHHLCTYLYSLAQTFNTFYNQHSILEKTSEEAAVGQAGSLSPTVAFRLLLTRAVATVLADGLDLLGIQTIEKM